MAVRWTIAYLENLKGISREPRNFLEFQIFANSDEVPELERDLLGVLRVLRLQMSGRADLYHVFIGQVVSQISFLI